MEREYKFLVENKELPKPMCIIKGYVQKSGRKLSFKYRNRYLELNPYKGILSRYKTYEDYKKNNPNEIMKILNISNCEINKEFFKFDYNDKKETYKTNTHKCSETWVKYIKKSINFYSFYKNLNKNYKNVEEYLQNEFKSIKTFIVIDISSGKEMIYDKNTNKEIKQNSIWNDLNLDMKKEDNKGIIEYYEKNLLGFKNYLIIDVIGKSFFGKVFKVMYKKDKKIYAMKVLNKERIIKKNFLKNIKNEMEILKKNKNIFLVNLYQTFQTPNNLYFIFEYCEGNDLDFYVENKKLFNEDEIKFIMSELIEGIDFLHKNGVIIKDLKTENILVDSEGHFKLNTFSLNKYLDLNSIENNNNNNNNNNDNNDSNSNNIINMISNGNINNNSGTLIYLAPEIINKKEITFKADVYSLGCIIYELFTGNNLYYNIKKEKLIEKILDKDYINKEIDSLSEKISENLKNLLKKMLEKDVEKRFNLEVIKLSEFFVDVKWEEIKEKKNKVIINLNEYRKKNLERESNDFNKINEIDFDDDDYTENNKNIQRIRKFTYIEGEENEEKDF